MSNEIGEGVFTFNTVYLSILFLNYYCSSLYVLIKMDILIKPINILKVFSWDTSLKTKYVFKKKFKN